MSSTAAALVEREQELGRLAVALSTVAVGWGRLLAVQGPAGIGKSSVLQAACDGARERGFVVLDAPGGEFERELGYGVVRRLFDPAIRRLSARERRTVLSGAWPGSRARCSRLPDRPPRSSRRRARASRHHQLFDPRGRRYA